MIYFCKWYSVKCLNLKYYPTQFHKKIRSLHETLILLETNSISLCHQYRAGPDPCSLTRLFTVGWPTFISSHLDISKMMMDNSKHWRWIISFKKFSWLGLKHIYNTFFSVKSLLFQILNEICWSVVKIVFRGHIIKVIYQIETKSIPGQC